jgi:hypothetical protein
MKCYFCNPKGDLSEWLKEHAWKVCIRETVSRVRIPQSPLETGKILYVYPSMLLKPVVVCIGAAEESMLRKSGLSAAVGPSPYKNQNNLVYLYNESLWLVIQI